MVRFIISELNVNTCEQFGSLTLDLMMEMCEIK